MSHARALTQADDHAEALVQDERPRQAEGLTQTEVMPRLSFRLMTMPRLSVARGSRSGRAMPGLLLRLMAMPRPSFRTKHAEDLTQTEVTPRLSFRLNHIAGIILPGNEEREKRTRCVQNQSVSEEPKCVRRAAGAVEEPRGWAQRTAASSVLDPRERDYSGLQATSSRARRGRSEQDACKPQSRTVFRLQYTKPHTAPLVCQQRGGQKGTVSR